MEQLNNIMGLSIDFPISIHQLLSRLCFDGQIAAVSVQEIYSIRASQYPQMVFSLVKFESKQAKTIMSRLLPDIPAFLSRLWQPAG